MPTTEDKITCAFKSVIIVIILFAILSYLFEGKARVESMGYGLSVLWTYELLLENKYKIANKKK